MKQLLIFLNVVLLALIVWAGFFWQPELDQTPLPGTHEARLGQAAPLAVAPSGGDFTLDGPQGPVALHDHAGKLVLLYFGYTYCPDVCPTSLMVWQQALASLSPAELARVQPIFVSVDPERDTVERLADYTQFFHPGMIGLTGKPGQLKEIADRYGAVYVRVEGASAGGYSVDHSAMTYVIDARGQLVASVPHGASVEQLLAEIRQYLPKT